MLDSGRGMLYEALKTLEGHWQAIEPHWQDQMAQQFTDTVLTPLRDMTAATLQGSEQLQALLAQMRRECSDQNYDVFASD
jgi:hypothetical protein